MNIRLENPSHEPTASSQAPYQDLKDMDFLYTFKIKIESQNLDHGPFNDQNFNINFRKIHNLDFEGAMNITVL